MNIQRYKWPVIIAASLHGALFMGTPEAAISRDEMSVAKPPPLAPLPEDTTIEFADPIDASSEGADSSGGGPVSPELPELFVALPDKATFTTPVTERVRTDRIVDPFKISMNGHGGPGDGLSDFSPGSITLSGQLDRQPRATAQISPDYPATMRHQGLGGSVMVEFDVNKEGCVVRAEVVRSTHREFEEAALRAVKRWQFEPGKRHGRVVPFRMTVPIEFSLGESVR